MEKVVTFWEAVERVKQGLPVIDRENKEGCRFIISMRINDMFIFGLDTEQIDITKPENWPLVSRHLYRVQKLTSSDYTFRHHLETTLKNDQTRIRISDLNKMNGIKVIIDHFGKIQKVGDL